MTSFALYRQTLIDIQKLKEISFPEIYEDKSLKNLHILFPHITIEKLVQFLERVEDFEDEVHSIAAPPVFVKNRFQGIMLYPANGSFRLHTGLVVSRYTMQNLWLKNSSWTPDYWEEAFDYNGWFLQDSFVDDVYISFRESTDKFLLEYSEHINRRNLLESLNTIYPITVHNYSLPISEEFRSEHYWEGRINMQIDLVIDKKTLVASKEETDCDLYPESSGNYFVNKTKNIPRSFSVPTPIKEILQLRGVME